MVSAEASHYGSTSLAHMHAPGQKESRSTAGPVMRQHRRLLLAVVGASMVVLATVIALAVLPQPKAQGPEELEQAAGGAHNILSQAQSLKKQAQALRAENRQFSAESKALSKEAKQEKQTVSALSERADRDRNALTLDDHDFKVDDARAQHDSEAALRDKQAVKKLRLQARKEGNLARTLSTKGKTLLAKAQKLRKSFLKTEEPMRQQQLALNAALRRYRKDTMKLANAEVSSEKLKAGERSEMDDKISSLRRLVANDKRSVSLNTRKMDHLSELANKASQAGNYMKLERKATTVLNNADDASDSSKDEDARSAGLDQKASVLQEDARGYARSAKDMARRGKELQSKVKAELAEEKVRLATAKAAQMKAASAKQKAAAAGKGAAAKKKLAARMAKRAKLLLQSEVNSNDDILKASGSQLDSY